MIPLSFGQALARGARAGLGRPGPPLLVALAATGGALATTLLWAASLGALAGARAGAFAPGLLVCVILAWVLQSAVLGGATLQDAAELRGRPVPSLGEAMVEAARRSLPWGVLAGLTLLVWSAWQLGVGGAGALLFLRGLVARQGGLAGALGLALAGSVGPLVALFLQLVVEMALVRSLCRDESPSVAGWEAGRTLLARPGLPVGLWALTALLAAAVAGTAAALASMGPPLPSGRELGVAALQAAIGGLATSVALRVRLGAFAALELSRSEELVPPPMPPRPPAVPRAELVLEPEPILEARAVGSAPETPG
ncbi:MAG TPA: hypothetical protein VEJ89_17840 [Myxococcaceae bacterium]|nr:hypothetical protein [Myxococcaceae bacterium]